jgi:hypothetical protein
VSVVRELDIRKLGGFLFLDSVHDLSLNFGCTRAYRSGTELVRDQRSRDRWAEMVNHRLDGHGRVVLADGMRLS